MLSRSRVSVVAVFNDFVKFRQLGESALS